MRLDEIRDIIMDTAAAHWHLLPDDSATYIHRFEHSGPGDDRSLDGLVEHRFRAVLSSDIDVGLVWGLNVERDVEVDWYTPMIDGQKISRDLVEVLYRGQPVDRVSYGIIDNSAGKVPWPDARFAKAVSITDDEPNPPEWHVTEYEVKIVELIESIGGGPLYRSAGQHVRALHFKVS